MGENMNCTSQKDISKVPKTYEKVIRDMKVRITV